MRFCCFVLIAIATSSADFYDDHSANNLTGWTSHGLRQWQAVNGYVSPAHGSNNQGFLISNYPVTADGVINANLTADQWNGYRGGLVFRFTSTSSYYFVAVNPANQYSKHLYFCVNTTDINNCSQIGEVGLNVGSTFDLTINISQNTFTFLIDNQLIGGAVDDQNISGGIGYGYHSEWNDYINFNSIGFIVPGTSSSEMSSSESQSSSQELSSSIPMSSSQLSSSSSSSSLAHSSSSSSNLQNEGPFLLKVLTSAHSQAANTVGIDVEIINESDRVYKNINYKYYMNWADHSAPLQVHIDWSNVNPITYSTNLREDYIAEINFDLGDFEIQPGARAIIKTRFNLEGYPNFNILNDPSWSGVNNAQGNQYVTVYTDGLLIYGEAATAPFPPSAPQSLEVTTVKSQESVNTLGIDATVKNTSLVPLNNVSFKYFANSIPTENLMVTIDYPTNTPLKVRVVQGNESIKEIIFDFGDDLFAAGATKVVKFRMHTPTYESVVFNDDPSYVGINPILPNPKVAHIVAGLMVGGYSPYNSMELDSDGDGIPDVIEVEVGSDPYNTQDAPAVALPNALYLTDDNPQYVSYDFSNIEGYTDLTNFAIQYNKSDFVDGKVPIIEAVANNQVIPFIRGFEVKDQFHIYGDISPGAEVEMKLPTPSAGLLIAPNNGGLFRFDPQAQKWDPKQVKIENESFVFKTTEFSYWITGQHFSLKDIDAGEDFSIFIDTTNFRAYSIGANNLGQLGIGTTIDNYSSAQEIQFGIQTDYRVVSVAAGESHALALLYVSTGSDWEYKVYAWGDNAHGKVKPGDNQLQFKLPVELDLGSVQDIKLNEYPNYVAAGKNHSIFMTNLGRAFGFGDNSMGQLAQGNNADENYDTVTNIVLMGKNFKFEPGDPNEQDFYEADGGRVHLFEVGGGNAHTLASARYTLNTQVEGAFWSWGVNTDWQLGQIIDNNGTLVKDIFSQTSIPKRVHPEAINVVNNKTITWGNKIGTGDHRSREVAVYGNYNMVRYGVPGWSNGAAWGGDIGAAQGLSVHCSPYIYTSEFDVGGSHCMQRHLFHMPGDPNTADFRIRLKGNSNDDYQLGHQDIGVDTGSVDIPGGAAKVAAGKNHSVISYEGTVYSWGKNYGSAPTSVYTNNEGRLWFSPIGHKVVHTRFFNLSGQVNIEDNSSISTTNLTLTFNGVQVNLVYDGTTGIFESDQIHAGFMQPGTYSAEITLDMGANLKVKAYQTVSIAVTELPVVAILTPVDGLIVPPGVNSINVQWTVDGVPQNTNDTEDISTITSGVSKTIVRSFTDPALNTGSASVTIQRGAVFGISNVSIPSINLDIPSASQFTFNFTINYPADITIEFFPYLLGTERASNWKKTFGHFSASSLTLNWDGKFDDGSIIPPGIYGYKIIAVSGQTTVEYLIARKTLSFTDERFESKSVEYTYSQNVPYREYFNLNTIISYSLGAIDEKSSYNSQLCAMRTRYVYKTNPATGIKLVKGGGYHDFQLKNIMENGWRVVDPWKERYSIYKKKMIDIHPNIFQVNHILPISNIKAPGQILSTTLSEVNLLTFDIDRAVDSIIVEIYNAPDMSVPIHTELLQDLGVGTGVVFKWTGLYDFNLGIKNLMGESYYPIKIRVFENGIETSTLTSVYLQ
jgi:alpha-tubulin suppressor-like RCC1 family protein